MAMKRRYFVIPWLVFLAAWLGGADSSVFAQRTAPAAEPVTILLFSKAVVDDSVVTLEQIAKLSGGPDTVRKRLAKLDVAEFRLGAAHATVLSEQVGFRLLLAGMSQAEFRLTGAARALLVESDEPVTLRKILGVAEQAVRERYPRAGAVSLTANRAIDVPLVAVGARDRVSLETRIRGSLPAIGSALVDVAILVNDKTREVVPVSVEVIPAEAAIATGARDSGGVRTAHYTTPARSASPGAPPVIKAADTVKLIARIGSARVEALGEAQQEGRVGDIIRVRNVESNRVVHGRIEAGGIVVVEY
jgi:flagella basal body P-ring formation protein FlgA